MDATLTKKGVVYACNTGCLSQHIHSVDVDGAAKSTGCASGGAAYAHVGWMLTDAAKIMGSPVAAARAAAATGAWFKSKHDMYLIRGSVGA